MKKDALDNGVPFATTVIIMIVVIVVMEVMTMADLAQKK